LFAWLESMVQLVYTKNEEVSFYIQINNSKLH